jgi:hypothetical protein
VEKSSRLGSAADGARAGRCERDPHGGGRGGGHRVPHHRGAVRQQQQPGPCLPAGVADISPGKAGQQQQQGPCLPAGVADISPGIAGQQQ